MSARLKKCWIYVRHHFDARGNRSGTFLARRSRHAVCPRWTRHTPWSSVDPLHLDGPIHIHSLRHVQLAGDGGLPHVGAAKLEYGLKAYATEARKPGVSIHEHGGPSENRVPTSLGRRAEWILHKAEGNCVVSKSMKRSGRVTPETVATSPIGVEFPLGAS